jgi:hypothetical protein
MHTENATVSQLKVSSTKRKAGNSWPLSGTAIENIYNALTVCKKEWLWTRIRIGFLVKEITSVPCPHQK